MEGRHAKVHWTEIKCRIGGLEHDQFAQSGSLRRRHCDARLEMVAGEGHGISANGIVTMGWTKNGTCLVPPSRSRKILTVVEKEA